MNGTANSGQIKSPVQNRMSPKGQAKLRLLIYAFVVSMIALVIVLDKSDIRNKHIWISIGSGVCVAVIYTLTIYYRYVSFPEKQKNLKAIIDIFANALALIAIIMTYISEVVTGKASALYVCLFTTGASNIIFGVIVGVLFSRVLFPAWDLYSIYRKI